MLELLFFRDAVFSNDGVWSKTIDVRRASASPELSINLVSQDYGKHAVSWYRVVVV